MNSILDPLNQVANISIHAKHNRVILRQNSGLVDAVTKQNPDNSELYVYDIPHVYFTPTRLVLIGRHCLRYVCRYGFQYITYIQYVYQMY